MEISNDVLFMLAIVLLFFCLMKDRPCNVEGLGAPASPNYNAKVTSKRNFSDWLYQQHAKNLDEWLSKNAKVDYSQCGPNGTGPCIPCNYIAKLSTGCDPKTQEGPNFNINGKDNFYAYTDKTNDTKCNGGKCGIVCESQFEGGPEESVKYGLPQKQNGLFCKM